MSKGEGGEKEPFQNDELDMDVEVWDGKRWDYRGKVKSNLTRNFSFPFLCPSPAVFLLLFQDTEKEYDACSYGL